MHFPFDLNAFFSPRLGGEGRGWIIGERFKLYETDNEFSYVSVLLNDVQEREETAATWASSTKKIYSLATVFCNHAISNDKRLQFAEFIFRKICIEIIRSYICHFHFPYLEYLKVWRITPQSFDCKPMDVIHSFYPYCVFL